MKEKGKGRKKYLCVWVKNGAVGKARILLATKWLVRHVAELIVFMEV